MDTDEEIRTAKSVWNRQNTVANCKATEDEREEGGGAREGRTQIMYLGLTRSMVQSWSF